jgi:myosin heavy subunit
VKNPELFKKAAELLEMDEEILFKSLLFKTREVGKSVMASPLNEADAIATRNSFTSNFYDRLFSWLVKRLNLTIIP